LYIIFVVHPFSNLTLKQKTPQKWLPPPLCLKKKNNIMKNKKPSHSSAIESALRSAYLEIQSTCMVGRAWNDMPALSGLSNKIRLAVEEVAVVAVVFVRGEDVLHVGEKFCTQLLQSHCNTNGNRLRTVLRRLCATGVLDINRDRETGCASYCLSNETERAIDEDDADGFKGAAPQGLDATLQFVSRRLLDRDHMLAKHVGEQIELAKRHNKDLLLIKYIEDKMMFCGIEEWFTLLAICTKAAIENEPFNFIYLDNYIHICRSDIQRLRQEILEGTWQPIQEGLVEITGSNVVEFNPDLQLTEAGFEHFLGELDPVFLKMIRRKMASVRTPMIQPEQVSKVNLYFSPELQRKTERLTRLLTVDGFRNYQSSMSKTDRMRGITLLFHGGPGCGKTEFALQLSRITKRPVMKIQVTDFMSKWVGDSEANLKRVFSDYRRVWERMEVQPILFLNECDQIIGRRLNAQSGVEQMQNGLQNLVLEEMETFGGILIGTTNLTQNMDPAFERRWTIKLQFDPPNTQAVAAIWKSQIKGLRQTEAELLANAFALTPGEISNIARRFAAEKLLGLEDTRLNTLIALCETERYHNVKASGVPLGFRVPGRQEMDMQNDRRKAG